MWKRLSDLLAETLYSPRAGLARAAAGNPAAKLSHRLVDVGVQIG
jgi:hypothetical protein